MGVSTVMAFSPVKERILTQVASLIGSFANDDDYREQLCPKTPEPAPLVMCLLFMWERSNPASPIVPKAMFALKQLCSKNNFQKLYIGKQIIPKSYNDSDFKKEFPSLTERLEEGKFSSDFLFQSIVLLQMLQLDCSENTQLMYESNVAEILQRE